MYYLLLGLMLYCFIIAIATKKKVVAEIFGIGLLTVVTFLIGFRYGVGIDYYNYEFSFHSRYQNFSSEIIYSGLRYIIKVLFGKFHYLTFIMILITNTFVYLGLKKRNINGAFLFCSLFIYISELAFIFANGMRQGVAAAIFFYASVYIRERDIKKFFVFMLIGAGFHQSILLLAPLYLFGNYKLSKGVFVLSILGSYVLVASGFAQQIFNEITYRLPLYSAYYNSDYMFRDNVNIFSVGVLAKVGLFLLLLFVANTESNDVYALEKTYYGFGVIINVLAMSTFMIGRIGIYFYMFSLVGIPKLLATVKVKRLREMIFMITILIAIAFYVQTLFIDAARLQLEYKSIFHK